MAGEAIAETAAGRLRGRLHDGAVQFTGVPYASAERFAPPVKPARWAGDRDAMSPGTAAPQPHRPAAEFTHGGLGPTSEDCLNLNVFTPSLSGSRPVLVWLHGGGFTIGHAGASLYHGGRLAIRADAVVVTVNYRLGSLGWLCHPDLAPDAGSPAGNWGLQDQIAALRWVRDNIANFGGDAARVTLAGQSAGALCAMDLLAAPAARGLFGRLILQSPPLVDVAQPAQRALDWALALSRLAGGESFDAERLRGLPAQRIVALHEELLERSPFQGTRGGALPTVEPATLPRSPLADPGASPHVDVLVGNTAEEGTFFFDSPWRPGPPVQRIPAIVGHLPAVNDANATIERYRVAADSRGQAADPLALLIGIATETMFAIPIAQWAGARLQALEPAHPRGDSHGAVYRYRFDHPGAGPQLGATHTAEVPLLFGTWSDGAAGQRLGGQTGGAADVADALQSAWTAFIHGDGPGWRSLARDCRADEVGVFGGRVPFSVESGDPCAG